MRWCRARLPMPCASADAVRVRRCGARPPVPCTSTCAVRVCRCLARPPARTIHGGGGPGLRPPVYCDKKLKLLLTPLTSRTKTAQWSSIWPETICSRKQNMTQIAEYAIKYAEYAAEYAEYGTVTTFFRVFRLSDFPSLPRDHFRSPVTGP